MSTSSKDKEASNKDFENFIPESIQKYVINLKPIHINDYASKDVSKESQSASNEMPEEAKLVQDALMQNMLDTGLCSSAQRSFSISNHIDSESTELRKILKNTLNFDQEKTNQNSVLYKALALDLFELNGVDRSIALNQQVEYSNKINEYYKQKFGRTLFDPRTEDEVVKRIIDLINSDEFQQYYKFGYHSLNAQKHTLKIDSELLNNFSKHIFDDQEKHSFDLSIKDILASPNTYDLIDKTQKQRVAHINMSNIHRVR